VLVFLPSWQSIVDVYNVAEQAEQYPEQFPVVPAHTGAVLMFLPSWQSIVDVYNALAAKPGVFERCIIHVLHSSLPMSEQQTVFDHAPPGGHQKLPESLCVLAVHFVVDKSSRAILQATWAVQRCCAKCEDTDSQGCPTYES
jgi:hypothetical protein